MAPPACDDDRQHSITYAQWSPQNHQKCYLMQRMVMYELVRHCALRATGIGVLPLELLVAKVLSRVLVALR